jgi:DNA-binding HxlR family transcriptional regulator
MERTGLFGELHLPLTPGLTERLLTVRLRSLEAAGIVTRRQYPEIPVRVEYALTDQRRASSRSSSKWNVGAAYERVLRIRDEERPAHPVHPDDEYRDKSLPRTLDVLIRLRHEHARVLEDVPPAAWSRTGIHQIQGEITILDITRHAAAHDA